MPVLRPATESRGPHLRAPQWFHALNETAGSSPGQPVTDDERVTEPGRRSGDGRTGRSDEPDEPDEPGEGDSTVAGLTRSEMEAAALEGRQVAGRLEKATSLRLLRDGEMTVVGRLLTARTRPSSAWSPASAKTPNERWRRVASTSRSAASGPCLTSRTGPWPAASLAPMPCRSDRLGHRPADGHARRAIRRGHGPVVGGGRRFGRSGRVDRFGQPCAAPYRRP